MAEGYARASGKVGVAMATSGPGATNLVTPIADAWMDSTPIVCITGQVRSNLIGTDAFQETDATGITMPIVKHSWLVQDVRELPQVMKNAFHVARTGRPGPGARRHRQGRAGGRARLLVPRRAGHARLAAADEGARAAGARGREGDRRGAAADHLRGRRRHQRRGLAPSCSRSSRRRGLPAVVTLMGKGCLPDSHPLNYGMPGMHGSKYGNWALNKSDLIIAVGTRFDDRVTGKVSAFAPGAKVIHFDIDAAEVDKIRHAEIPVVGPLKLALEPADARGQGARGRPRDRAHRLARAARGVARALSRTSTASAEGVLKPQTVLETLRDMTAGRDDVIWTTGVGQHQMWAMQYLVCDRPRTFITSGGLGTMGYGLPAAVGAKAARPDATVVCIDGDGCFQMTCQELATAALERLPIVVVIVNNGWLGMVRQWQELFYAERFAETHLTKQVPDYAELADALGCAGFMVDNEDDLESTLQAAFDCGRTAVVDARVDPDENCYPMVPAGAASVDIIEMPDEMPDGLPEEITG